MPEAYTGPYEAVEVPALGVIVKRGEPVTISDPSVRASLLRSGHWETVKNDDDDSADDDKASASEVRSWAKSVGLEVSSRGTIPADVRERYNAAHAPGKDAVK